MVQLDAGLAALYTRIIVCRSEGKCSCPDSQHFSISLMALPLCVVVDGSSPEYYHSAQASVGLTEGMIGKSTSAGMHLVLHPFLSQSSTTSWYFTLFLFCVSFILSSQGPVNISEMSCLVVAETKMMSCLYVDWVICDGNFLTASPGQCSSLSLVPCSSITCLHIDKIPDSIHCFISYCILTELGGLRDFHFRPHWAASSNTKHCSLDTN